MHAFSETDKLAYMGESDDANMFHFTCFNVEDPGTNLLSEGTGSLQCG